jgi:hypothetical protein
MESRIQDALLYIQQFPNAKVAKVAKEFGVPRGRLRYRLQGLYPKDGHHASNAKLTGPEEEALCRYIERLDYANLAIRPEFVTDAANAILQERLSKNAKPEDKLVSKMWTTRFLKRHKYLREKQKKLSQDRQAAEDLRIVQVYFERLAAIIQGHGILPESIWNMDETGFRIGIGKDQFVVTKRKRIHYFGTPENRESATAIEAISAGGSVIPVFLILSGQVHMAQWYQIPGLDPDMALRPTITGYSNDQVAMEWIEHFEKHSAKTSLGKKRLLILDGHGSHHTKPFIQYCYNHDIVPFGLPPNLTHLLQPLDVVVFQPLKHYHAKALDIMIRDGLLNITKLEFLSCIGDVRKQAFKRSTILSAFRKTGIWPLDSQKVLPALAERQPQRTPTPPTQEPSSSPFSTPLTFRQMNKVANNLETVLKRDGEVNPTFAHDLTKFIKGSLTMATELIQTKRDLGRTRKAEDTRKRRRLIKNTPLQTGGVLTVADAREMIQHREEDEVEKARKILEAAEAKVRRAYKRWFEEAAKEARKWRISGKLLPANVYDSELGLRILKRC